MIINISIVPPSKLWCGICKKDLSEFTYLFSDVTFEIIKIDKNKQGRIVNIIVREKEKKQE